MIGILFALLGGLVKSLADLVFKKSLQKGTSEYILAWARFAFAVPFLLIILFFIEIPKMDSTFWIVVFIGALLDVLAIYLYLRAINISPLSLAIPMLGLTPLFIILTSFLFIGELPSLIGLVGIIIVVIGVYVLGINTGKSGILAPFKSLTSEKGVLLMLIVAFIFSIIPNMQKIGTLHSSVIFVTIVYIILAALICTSYTFYKSRKSFKEISHNKITFLLLGIFTICEIFFLLFAFNHILVNYAISIKRLSILFSVLFGFIFFKEKSIKSRLTGAIIIIMGIILIAFS